MDFEVVSSEETEKSFLGELENFFRNRRRQLQDWEADPPHRLGFFVLFVVSLELVLSRKLIHNQGLDRRLLADALSSAVLILMTELALAKVGQEVGEFFKKKGKILTTVSFFNLGLLPLVLILPVTLLDWTLPHLELITLIVVIFLMTKVLANFREALEIAFEFSRLQSALVLYLSAGLITVGAVIAVYVSFFSLLADLASNL